MEQIELSENSFVGNGKERNCYIHPNEPDIAVKVNHGDIRKQTDRELKFYRGLNKRKNIVYKHIPRYFGPVQTNFGTGHMFDLIRDYDGKISRSLLQYLEDGLPLRDFESDLALLKQSLLDNQIIFNHDMYAGNLLYKKVSETSGYLVVIDGLGDTVFVNWLNSFASHRTKKIERRWELFINRLRNRAAKLEMPDKRIHNN